MLSYIILTYLLLTLGLGFYYLLVRNRFSSSGQKVALLSILGLSVLIPVIPLFFDSMMMPDFLEKELKAASSNSPIATVEPTPEVYFIEQSVLIDFCPTDELLETCYQEAITVEQFCNCDHIEKENLLYYEANSFYNFLSWQELAFWKILAWAAFGILIFLLGNVLYLYYLVKRSRKETITLDDQSFTLLRPHKPLSVASFRLFGRYIIWQEEMKDLSEMELEAVYRHEVAHIRHMDTWIKIFINLLQVLWFAHPGFFWVRSEIERLTEYLADEWAVKYWGNPKAYAQMLLKMKVGNRQPSMTQGLKKTNKLFKQRIQHILDFDPPAKNKSSIQLSSIFPKLVQSLNIVMIAAIFTLVCNYSFPIIDQQIDKLKIYQTLGEHSQEDGRNTFCKVCLQKELEAACRD